jgi:hypothetical protein
MTLSNGEYDDDEEFVNETAITFHPREDDLLAVGITLEQFEEALLDALEKNEALSAEDSSPFQELELSIEGKRIRLGDVADIEIGVPVDDLDDFDVDQDDDDEDEEDTDEDDED